MTRIARIALALGAVACGKGGEELSPDLVMTQANNYSSTADFSIETVAVAAGSDATVDWCNLAVDIRGRQVVPSEIDRMVLIELALTPEETIAAIEANEITQEVTVTQWIFQNETEQRCTAMLTEFEILANGFNPQDFVDGPNTWLLSATYFEDARFDFAMSLFVDPTDGEPNTQITVDDGSALLDFEADLHSAPPLVTSASFDAYTLDWSAVKTDVNGADFDDELGNQVLIGKVPVETVEEVEAIFLRVDDEAEELYRLNEVDGVPVVFGETQADLMLATDEAGNPFPGFTTDGIWLVGVECTTCTSPAPLLLSVVQVEE